MMDVMVIFGVVIGLEAAAVWALGKVFKDLNDEELDTVVKAIQEAQCKKLW
jgi:hypothetical protein